MLERIGPSCYGLNISCIMNGTLFECVILVHRKDLYMVSW